METFQQTLKINIVIYPLEFCSCVTGSLKVRKVKLPSVGAALAMCPII